MYFAKGRKRNNTALHAHYEDVFDWHYRFTINRWATARTLNTRGNNQEPFYADARTDILEHNDRRLMGEPSCPNDADAYGHRSVLLGCERPGRQVARHYFMADPFVDGLPEHECSTNLNFWNALKIETLLRGEYYRQQMLVDCDGVRFNERR